MSRIRAVNSGRVEIHREDLIADELNQVSHALLVVDCDEERVGVFTSIRSVAANEGGRSLRLVSPRFTRLAS